MKKLLMNARLITLLAVVPAMGFAPSYAADSPSPISARLNEAQKQEIRVNLDNALANVNASIEKAKSSGQPLLAEFALLSKEYLDLIRIITLGEHVDGTPATTPTDQNVIDLIDRTQARIATFRDRFADNPQLEAIMPHVDMVNRQLAVSRLQLVSRRSLATMDASAPVDVGELYDRASRHLDDAEQSIEGSPDEHLLRERIERARRQLEQGRPTDASPTTDETTGQ